MAGKCKTRLIPRVGARGAAWVHRWLCLRALATAHAAAVQLENAQVWLYCAPTPAHGFFTGLRLSHGTRLAQQRRGDLGLKMQQAIAHRLGNGPVLLMGSDAYGLSSNDLVAAYAALAQHHYLLWPAPDGGYGLIGASKRLPSLRGIAWSSGKEGRQTHALLRAAGSVAVMPQPRADFDTPSDWQKARRSGQLPALVHLARP